MSSTAIHQSAVLYHSARVLRCGAALTAALATHAAVLYPLGSLQPQGEAAPESGLQVLIGSSDLLGRGGQAGDVAVADAGDVVAGEAAAVAAGAEAAEVQPVEEGVVSSIDAGDPPALAEAPSAEEALAAPAAEAPDEARLADAALAEADAAEAAPEEARSAEPTPVEAQAMETAPAEARAAETTPVEARATETALAEAQAAETTLVEATETALAEAQSAATAQVEARAAEPALVEAQATEATPVEAQATEAAPAEAQAAAAALAQAQATETTPVEAQATEATPVEAQAAEAAPVEAQATETTPVEAQATEAAPVEAQTAETTLAQMRATEAAPAEARAAGTVLAEARATEAPPAEARAAETELAQARAAETPPAEAQIAQATLAEAPAAVTAPAETRAAVTTPAEAPDTVLPEARAAEAAPAEAGVAVTTPMEAQAPTLAEARAPEAAPVEARTLQAVEATVAESSGTALPPEQVATAAPVEQVAAAPEVEAVPASVAGSVVTATVTEPLSPAGGSGALVEPTSSETPGADASPIDRGSETEGSTSTLPPDAPPVAAPPTAEPIEVTAEVLPSAELVAMVEQPSALEPTGPAPAPAARPRLSDAEHAGIASGVAALRAAPAVTPEWEAAMRRYARTLGAAAPDDERARALRDRIAEAYLGAARESMEDGRVGRAWSLLEEAVALAREESDMSAALERLRAEIGEIVAGFGERPGAGRERYLGTLELVVLAHTVRLDLDAAVDVYYRLRLLRPKDDPFVSVIAPRRIAAAYVAAADAQSREGRFERARAYLEAARRFYPTMPAIAAAAQRHARQERIADLELRIAKAAPDDMRAFRDELDALEAQDPDAYRRLVRRVGLALLARLRDLVAQDRARAASLLEAARVLLGAASPLGAIDFAVLADERQLLAAARQHLEAARLTAAQGVLDRLEAGMPPVRATRSLVAEVDEQRAAARTEFEAHRASLATGDLDGASASLDRAIALWADNAEFAAGKSAVDKRRLELASERPRETPAKRTRGRCSAGYAGKGRRRWAECHDPLPKHNRTPRLVVIPGGDEVREVFAITKYEVSVGDFNVYCSLSRECSPITGVSERHPVTGISLEQARAYARWLSATTRVAYRLPSEAEWLHAARAGGKQPPDNFNCRVLSGGRAIKGSRAVDVNSGDQNGWGLVNYIGNVREWVETPDGIVARGGAFSDGISSCSIELAVPHRGGADALTGFRLVREIEPQT